MDDRLTKTNNILHSLDETITSFFDLYSSIDDVDTSKKQNLLRAVILFSCSGIDAIIKQLVNDTLESVIERDEGAFNQLKDYVSKQMMLKTEPGVNAKLFAELFTCENPKKSLIENLKNYLKSGSLQSADEIFKAGSYFNIKSDDLEPSSADKEKLRSIFTARNQITHEMDVDMNEQTFTIRERTFDEAMDYSKHIIDLARRFISSVSIKLANEDISEDLEQIVSL